jgi:hypothetical protein
MLDGILLLLWARSPGIALTAVAGSRIELPSTMKNFLGFSFNGELLRLSQHSQ